jgi:pimeloyl-ACP methyl ester carboxylesterase
MADCDTGLMMQSSGERTLVSTTAGPVEIVHIPGDRPPVLFFPGGHCSARSDCGWELYTASGYGVVSFSRPGYGGTRVGRLGPARFATVVREVCSQLDIAVTAAAVGVSFGGLQAIHVAGGRGRGVDIPRLVLHSCAPSTIAYPDSRAQAIGGRLLFAPPVERVVWALVRRMIESDAGLRWLMGRLSTLPVGTWWDRFGVADRDRARTLFSSMSSGSGFILDLAQGRAGGSEPRRLAMASVRCPTLVTGSPYDRGVAFAHAEDLAAGIPGASLVELDSPSHLFWLGPGREKATSIVSSFLGG